MIDEILVVDVMHLNCVSKEDWQSNKCRNKVQYPRKARVSATKDVKDNSLRLGKLIEGRRCLESFYGCPATGISTNEDQWERLEITDLPI